ncbi:MAG TPA: trypsin [Syntrophobacteraceae bacterium]|nr:trypsin [Syntrophobacteraceae bacterium]
MTSWFTVVAMISCLFLVAPAYGEPRREKTLSPYFMVEGEDSSANRFPLKGTKVAVTVNGVIAEVYVSQKYANDGTQPINARYVFPASTQASVHGLKMVIGDRMVTAKIKERTAAKQEFESAKREGKSASLLEQQRPNVFTMNVANIMPKDEVQVELHYTELLVPTEGTYEFVYPTVVGPRYSNQPEAGAAETDQWVKSPYLKEGNLPPTGFQIAATLAAGLPIQEVTCPSHTVDVQWDSQSSAKVSLAPTGEFAGNRDFILKYRLAGKTIQSGLLLHEGEKENFFLLMVQPPERVKPADIPPREYIFILDVSGSMHGFPLDTAKVLIKDLLSHLQERDTFNVILFSGTSSVLAPKSLAATGENVGTAIQHIDRQKGGGGTELAAALTSALSLPRDEAVSRSVVVITDGYIAAEREAFHLIQNNLNRTNVFAFGIGTSVNRFLIEGIAKTGMGEPFVVTKPEEAPAAAARFRAYVQSPVLTNVQVRYKDFDAYDVEPPAIPDLFAQRPLVVFGKWRGPARGSIEVSGRSGPGDYAHTFELSDTKPQVSHGALRYLWARSRIARLADFAMGRAPEENKEHITQLGLEYSLLTQYTSFVAVLEEIRNTGPRATDVDQPLPLPLHVSNLAVGGGGVNTPEPELTVLIPLTILILLGGFWYGKRFRLKGKGMAV